MRLKSRKLSSRIGKTCVRGSELALLEAVLLALRHSQFAPAFLEEGERASGFQAGGPTSGEFFPVPGSAQ